MEQPNTRNRPAGLLALSLGLGLLVTATLTTGCLKIGGNEPLLRIDNGNPPPQAVDTSRVQVRDLDDARQQIAQAHARINYLEQQNADLRQDKDELKADLKKAKSERNMYKDRYEKATGQD